MSGVFISHASADRSLLDEFVDKLIRLGCGLTPDQIFYSSGEDTGVPSGEDLNTFVRDEVASADLVVAIITPAFRTRPFCVAELGAAWSRVGNLFPIALPGMGRTDLDGVLAEMAVRFLDDSAALDELHDRVGEAVGTATPAKTWGRYKQQWLANVQAYVEALPEVKVATIDDLDRARADLEGARAALVDSEAERRALEEQVRALAEAKSAEEIAEILLPKEDVARFEALVKQASDAVHGLDSIVIEALWYHAVEGGMPWPDQFDDAGRFERAQSAHRDRMLVEDSSELLVPNYEVIDIKEAEAAIEALRRFLATETSENFDDWFRQKYRMPPDLRSQKVFNQLI